MKISLSQPSCVLAGDSAVAPTVFDGRRLEIVGTGVLDGPWQQGMEKIEDWRVKSEDPAISTLHSSISNLYPFSASGILQSACSVGNHGVSQIMERSEKSWGAIEAPQFMTRSVKSFPCRLL